MAIDADTREPTPPTQSSVIVQLILAALAGTGLFFGVTVVAGYVYLTLFLEGLGIPRSAVSFSPHEYALVASPLFATLALGLFPAGLFRVYAELTSAEPLSRIHIAGLNIRRVAELVFMLGALIVSGILVTEFWLLRFDDNPSPGLLSALVNTLSFASFVTFFVAPLVWDSRRFAFSVIPAVLLLLVVSGVPVFGGTIDAKLALASYRYTQEAVIYISTPDQTGLSPGVRGDVVMIRSDNLYFLTIGDPDDRSIIVVPMDRIESIEYLR